MFDISNDTLEIRAQRLSKAFGFTITVDQLFVDEIGDIDFRFTDEQRKIYDALPNSFWDTFDLRETVV